MGINFDRDRFLSMNENRPNVLLMRRLSHGPTNPQQNAYQLNHFPISNATMKPRCLFGAPGDSDTAVLCEDMFVRERLRGITKYLFDVATGRPVQETPPSSPQIGSNTYAKASSSSDLCVPTGNQVQIRKSENNNESVISYQKNRNEGAHLEIDIAISPRSSTTSSSTPSPPCSPPTEASRNPKRKLFNSDDTAENEVDRERSKKPRTD